MPRPLYGLAKPFAALPLPHLQAASPRRPSSWLACALLALGMAGCAVHDSAYYGDGHYGHVRGHSLGGYAYPPGAYSLPPGALRHGRYGGQPVYLVPYPGPDYYWSDQRPPYYIPPPGHGPHYGYPHGQRPAPRAPSWLNRKPPPSVPAPPSGAAQQGLDRPFQPSGDARRPHQWLQPQAPRPSGASVLRPLP